MSQLMNVACWASILGVARLATSADVGGNDFLRKNATISISTTDLHADPLSSMFATSKYGKSKCPCVGIDNIEGYYATNMDFYHVQYPLEAGSSCHPWDLSAHPDCMGGDGPAWCMEAWCYVDPCNCELEDLPGLSKAGVEYQGGPAYWSYNTCGFMDLYTKSMSKDACVAQENQTACEALPKCMWDNSGDLWSVDDSTGESIRGLRKGGQCGGRKAVETCKGANKAMANEPTLYGMEGCQCIGLAGRTPGKAFLYINSQDQIAYPPDVGSTCRAWEADTHPECLKEGVEVPEWCGQSWCFVDPCKCKTAQPPKIVMEANQNLKFQGKTAFWSPETCGNKDSWSTAHTGEYCVTQKSEEDCNANRRCGWTGTACLGTALVSICAKQQETGILGFEAFPSGSPTLRSFYAFLLLLGSLASV